MKTVLVTGGAGFIGSHFVRLLIKKNKYFVINFDLLTYAGNLDNLKDVEMNPNYKFIMGDVRDREMIETLFNNYEIDYVVNFAAESHVDRSIVSADDFITTNILGSQILMEVARNNWFSNKSKSFKSSARFIQISTDEVYGPTIYDSFDERALLKPSSPYAASKASADLIAKSYFTTYGFPIIITRCSNNYGPNQFPEKLIPYFISLAIQNKNLPLYGNGQQIRDWIHVMDHCSAIEILLNNGKIGETYNIGANNEIKNIDIAKLILNSLNKSEKLISFVQDRLGHDVRYSINSEKIRLNFGWEPKYDFSDNIQLLIQLEVVRNSQL